MNCVAHIDVVRYEAERLRDEEQDYLDEMPDSLASGSRGATAVEAAYAIEAAYDAIDTAHDQLQEAMDSIEQFTNP